MEVDQEYRFSVEECDVDDRERLIKFRRKRSEWLDWFEQDTHHAISRQINNMMWSDAVFRLVNATRFRAAEAGGSFATKSRVLADAIDRGFLFEQLAAFRRLTEEEANSPKRQVISLTRLIEDIRRHRELITREIFVCYDGLPFDDRDRREASDREESGVDFEWLDTSGPKAFDMSSVMHEQFDRLLGRPQASRSRDEALPDSAFIEISAVFERAPFDRATRYLNKMVLHAADAGSRGKEPIDPLRLQDIWDCQKALLWSAGRIAGVFFADQPGAVPKPQFDMLEHWASPFAPKEAFEELYAAWRDENEERTRWVDRAG